MSTPNQSNSASTAKLLAEDHSLLTALTVIWSGLFVLGVIIYTAVATWTFTHPLGHGS
jgi:hypothetical protein